MIEAEAKTTLCCGPPAVAASNYYRAGVAVEAPLTCMGSICMAWRWKFGGPSDPPNSGDPGYCGLAGAPA